MTYQERLNPIPRVEQMQLEENMPLHFWAKKLYNECGIDWFQVQKYLEPLHNFPGIYPDTAVMLCKLIKFYGLKSILEFGSGTSTLIFAQMAKRYGLKLVTYEEVPKYLDETAGMLHKWNLPTDCLHLTGSFTPPENFKQDFESADLLFDDASGDLRNPILRGVPKLAPNIPLVIFDDVDGRNTPVICEFIERSRRQYWYVFNGGARMDRCQFISYLPNLYLTEFMYKKMGFF